MMQRIILLPAVLIILQASAFSQTYPRGNAGDVVQIAKVKVGPGAVVDFAVYNRDASILAYGLKKDGRMTLTVDGRQVASHEEIKRFNFLEGGKDFRYTYRDGKSWYLRFRDKSYGPFDEIKSLEGDGGHCFLTGKSGNDFMIVAGGAQFAGLSEQAVNTFRHSVKTGEYAFVDGKGPEKRVFINGKRFGPYAKVYDFKFLPDAGKYAFTYSRDGKTYLYHDGKTEGPFTEDDTRSWMFDRDIPSDVEFSYSMDGAVFGYIFPRNGKYYLKINDLEYGPYYDPAADTTKLDDQTSRNGWYASWLNYTFTLSENGRFFSVCYFSKDWKSHIIIGEINGGKITDKKLGPFSDDISSVYFSPDGSKYFFWEEQMPVKFYLNGKPFQAPHEVNIEKPAQEVRDNNRSIMRPFFSPDSSHWGFRYFTGGGMKQEPRKAVIVLDGRVVHEKESEIIYLPVFSRDSKRMLMVYAGDLHGAVQYAEFDGKKYGPADGFDFTFLETQSCCRIFWYRDKSGTTLVNDGDLYGPDCFYFDIHERMKKFAAQYTSAAGDRLVVQKKEYGPYKKIFNMGFDKKSRLIFVTGSDGELTVHGVD